MSKTKDLLPVKQAIDAIKDNFDAIKEDLKNDADYGDGQDENGNLELYIENYDAFCENEADFYLEQFSDIDTLNYDDQIAARDQVIAFLLDKLSDYESELCLEALERIKDKE